MFARRLRIRRLCSSVTQFLRDYRIVWSLTSDGRRYRSLGNALAAQSMICRKNPISFTLGYGTFFSPWPTLLSSSLAATRPLFLTRHAGAASKTNLHGSSLIILDKWFEPFAMKISLDIVLVIYQFPINTYDTRIVSSLWINPRGEPSDVAIKNIPERPV